MRNLFGIVGIVMLLATVACSPREAVRGVWVQDTLALEGFTNQSASGNLSIRNLSGQALAFSLSSNQPWLSLTPAQGTLAGRTTLEVAVTAVCTPGANEATVTLTTPGGTDTATVTINCREAGRPTLAPGVWTRIVPEGDTMCADGSPFVYYVHPGTVNKLVVDFQGGGACWDDGTCPFPQDPFRGVNGVYLPYVVGSPQDLLEARVYGGIYDRSRLDNPISDYYHVYIPYCTGDIHLGDAVRDYRHAPTGREITVRHKGAVNARAVLDWVFTGFEAPETVLMTGCSAGAYGAITYMPPVQRRYPGARVHTFADSGAGIVTEAFASVAYTNWNALPNLPTLPNFTPDFRADLITDFYLTIARTFPQSCITQFHTLQDGTQRNFYRLMGGEIAEWSPRMVESMTRLETLAPNFSAYLSNLDRDGNPENGTAHCIITNDSFYTERTAGVELTTWLETLLRDEQPARVRP